MNTTIDNSFLLEMKLRRAIESGKLSRKSIQKLIDNNMFPTFNRYREGVNKGIENVKRKYRFSEKLLTKNNSLDKKYLRASYSPIKKIMFVPKGETASPSELYSRFHESREAIRNQLVQPLNFNKKINSSDSKFLLDLFNKGFISEGEYKYILKHGFKNKNKKILHLIRKLKSKGIILKTDDNFFGGGFINKGLRKNGIGSIDSNFLNLNSNPIYTITNNLHNPGVMKDSKRVRDTIRNAYGGIDDCYGGFNSILSNLTTKQDIQWRKKFYYDINNNVKIRQFFLDPTISMSKKEQFLINNYLLKTPV